MSRNLFWLCDDAWAAIEPRLPKRRPGARRVDERLADRDCDCDCDCEAVIPPNPTRKHPHPDVNTAYRLRNVVERLHCRLKDFRRRATLRDKRADTFLSAVFLVAAVVRWAD